MDWFTHIFFAVALAMAFRRNRTTGVAMGFGAMAPDLDALLTPVTILAPQLWFLDHRTISHSVLTGLPWALLVTWVVQRPPVLAAWRRIFRLDISLPMDRSILLPMYVGVLSHIALDGLTVQGPALFAPLSAARYQLDWFYFIDLPPLAVSAVLVILTLWQLGSPDTRRVVLALLLGVVAVTGTVRGFEHAALAPDDRGNAIPTWHPGEWWTWRDLPNGSVEVSLVAPGSPAPLFRAWFPRLELPAGPGPPGDLDRTRGIAEGTLDFTAFRMNTYTVSLNASLEPSGTWRLAYFDPVRRGMAVRAGTENMFSPEDLVVRVAPDGSVTVAWP